MVPNTYFIELGEGFTWKGEEGRKEGDIPFTKLYSLPGGIEHIHIYMLVGSGVPYAMHRRP